MESKAEVNKKEIPLRTDSSSCEGRAGLVMTGMNLRREETAHQSAASAIATTKPPMMVVGRYSLAAAAAARRG
jgi:hypothetical protein